MPSLSTKIVELGSADSMRVCMYYVDMDVRATIDKPDSKPGQASLSNSQYVAEHLPLGEGGGQTNAGVSVSYLMSSKAGPPSEAETGSQNH